MHGTKRHAIHTSTTTGATPTGTASTLVVTADAPAVVVTR